MISAVIFDMDGLMFGTEALNMRAWSDAGRQHGYEITEEIMHEYIGLALPETRRRMTARFGPGFDFDQVRGSRLAWSRAWIEKHGTPEQPGLHELLAWLGREGIRAAVATSSSRDILDFYVSHSTLKGDSLFDAIVTGEQVSRGKPNPDIFLTAAQRLGANPEECAVLEDSYHGIQAASAAGMVPIMVPDLLPPIPEVRALAYAVVPSLREVIPILEALNQGELHYSMAEGGAAV